MSNTITSNIVAPSTAKPRWLLIAEKLESFAAAPTEEQVRVAAATGISIPADVPAPVAAVVIQYELSSVLFRKLGTKAEIPEALNDLELELGIVSPAYLTTGSHQEVSGWFHARYMTKTARGLRDLQPEVGDVVSGHSGPSQNRVISSVGDDGRVHFRGRPSGRAWPNHLVVVERIGAPGHARAVAAVDGALRNATTYTSIGFEKFAALEAFALDRHIPEPEAVRALEELLESGETQETPFQRLVETYPALLASTVMGGWKTFVIPQKRLGSEYVPDFLVLGVNSVGPQWVAVEIEAARHKIVNKDRSLSTPTRHAVNQVKDWREWLTINVAYAQNTLGLHGLTNRVPGLVIIGRDSPSSERQPSRAQSDEDAGIEIHSWDWLLRHAQRMMENALQVSEFAVRNASDQASV